MKKSTIFKKLDHYEEALVNQIQDLQDFLDSIDDPEISEMADHLCRGLVDFLTSDGSVSLNDIRDHVEAEFEK